MTMSTGGVRRAWHCDMYRARLGRAVCAAPRTTRVIDMPPTIERSFVSTPSGRIHIAAAGSGQPILLLHQTPRSWDEFREVLPLLGRHFRAIAMDTMGYGDSDQLPMEAISIENLAASAHQLLEALGHRSVVVVGHHTGAVIALEIAAAY